MARRMQHRDVSEPIEALVREFCDQHGIAAIYQGELARPLIEHANEVLQRGINQAYEDGKNAAAKETT